MRKINLLLSAMALGAFGFAAQAGVMAPATTVAGYGWVQADCLIDYASTMVVTWNQEEISFVEESPTVQLVLPNGNSQTIQGEYNLRLGAPYSYDPHDCLSISLGYLTDSGDYTVKIPAGLVENTAGDTNPAQDIKFTIVTGSLSTYDDEFTVNPPQSTSEYDYETGNYTAAPFYVSSDLSNVSISWTGYNLVATGTGKVEGYKEYGQNVDFTPNVKVENGKIVIDLSSLDDGDWTITIPSGFVKADTDKGIYANSTINLEYIVLNNPSALSAPVVTNPRAGSYYVDYLNYIQMDFDSPVRLADNAPKVTYTYKGETKDCPNVYLESRYGTYSLYANLNESSYDSLDEPGLYTINLPAGVVTNGKYSNEAATFEYYIVNETEDFTVTPANKSYVTSSELATIKITYADVTEIEANTRSWQDVTVRGGTYGNYIYDYTIKMGQGIAIDGNSIVITLPEVKQVGYWITIPSKNFIMDGALTNAYVNLEYTVWDGLPQATVLEGPAQSDQDNTKVTPNVQVLVTWDYQSVTPTDNFKIELNKNGYYDTDAVEVPADAYSLVNIENPAGGEGSALKIDLKDVLTQYLEDNDNSNQDFKLTIPAGIVKNADGLENPSISFTFTVYPQTPYELNLVADEELEGVYYLYFTEQSWMSSPAYALCLTLTNHRGVVTDLVEGSYVYYPEDLMAGEYAKMYIETEAYEGNAIVLNIADVEDDVYTLTVPEGFALYNFSDSGWTDYANPKTTFTITVGEPEAEIVIESANAANIEQTVAEIVVEFTDFLIPEGSTYEAVATDTISKVEYKAEVTEEGKVTISLGELTADTEYIFSVVVNALDADGEVVVTSEPVEVKFTTLEEEVEGIYGISEDQAKARYFTIDGVEIASPQPGTICIKIQNNKATKILVK